MPAPSLSPLPDELLALVLDYVQGKPEPRHYRARQAALRALSRVSKRVGSLARQRLVETAHVVVKADSYGGADALDKFNSPDRTCTPSSSATPSSPPPHSSSPGYVGYSDAFDHLPQDGSDPYWRVPGHFVSPSRRPGSLNQLVLQTVALFKQRHPEHAANVFIFLSVLGSAEKVPSDVMHADMMDVEALHATARLVHAKTGGCCTAPCGNLCGSPLQTALGGLPREARIADVDVAYPILGIVAQHYAGLETVGDVFTELERRADEQEARQLADKQAAAAEGAQQLNGPSGEPTEPPTFAKSIRTPRFAKGTPKMRQVSAARGRTLPQARARPKAKFGARAPTTPAPITAAASVASPVDASSSSITSSSTPSRTHTTKRFTPDEDRQLKRLRDDENRTWHAIGATLGRNRVTAQRRYELLNTKGEERYRRYTPEEDQRIKQLKEVDGLTWKAIGEDIGTNGPSVQSRYLGSLKNK